MPGRARREEKNATDNQDRKDPGGGEPPQRQPAILKGLVQEIAYRRPQWPREDEGRPKQTCSGHAGQGIEASDRGEGRREHERSALISEAGAVGRSVAERSARVCENMTVAQ